MHTSFKLSLTAAWIFGIAAIAACSSTTVSKVTDSADGSATDGGTPAEDGSAEEDSATPLPAKPFELTSTALTEGATFAKDNTCTGADEQPDLTWGPGPEGTKSYAIVFNDKTINFVHGVTYDIPPTLTALPAAVENEYLPKNAPGAKQTLSFRTGLYGYAGPCAPKPREDVYEFILYALDVETLPSMTKTSTRDEAAAEVKKHVLKTVKLTGKYKQI